MGGEVSLDRLSNDDLSAAVLQALWPLPRLVVTGVIPVRQPEIDNARRRCVNLRRWLRQQSMTRRVRNAYVQWIEFCEQSIVEAEDELRTGRKRQEFERGQKDLRDRTRRALTAASELPRPPRVE